MKIGKRVTINRTEVKHDRTVCDICGQRIDDTRGWRQDDVTVEAKVGDVFPEGDFRKVKWTDVCPACFDAKVVPALEALGCEFYERDADDWGADVIYQKIEEETDVQE